METISCPNCGNMMPADAPVCAFCGAQINGQPSDYGTAYPNVAPVMPPPPPANPVPAAPPPYVASPAPPAPPAPPQYSEPAMPSAPAMPEYEEPEDTQLMAPPAPPAAPGFEAPTTQFDPPIPSPGDEPVEPMYTDPAEAQPQFPEAPQPQFQPPVPAAEPKKKRSPWVLISIIAGILLLMGIAAAVTYYFIQRDAEPTVIEMTDSSDASSASTASDENASEASLEQNEAPDDQISEPGAFDDGADKQSVAPAKPEVKPRPQQVQRPQPTRPQPQPQKPQPQKPNYNNQPANQNQPHRDLEYERLRRGQGGQRVM